MKKILAILVVAAAGIGLSAFAQNTKEDVIAFYLTEQGQTSVSAVNGTVNGGTFSQRPRYYNTTRSQLTQYDVIQAISQVLYHTNNFYSSAAQIILAQGELSGFFNITPALSNSTAVYVTSNSLPILSGTFNTTNAMAVSTRTNSALDLSASTNAMFIAWDNGRNFETNPIVTNSYPVGHLQPWGQIFIKDPVSIIRYFTNSITINNRPTNVVTSVTNSPTNPWCDNVTYFFSMSVQECYDCFYMNSFMSTASFSVSSVKPSTTNNGPACCEMYSNSNRIAGSGTDYYYLTLSFDNTINNPYLNSNNASLYVGHQGIILYTNYPKAGLNPDVLPYQDKILNAYMLTTNNPYEMRFTLNGQMSYQWNLINVNPTDASEDFYGYGQLSAYGFGLISLTCELLQGTVTFTDELIPSNYACLDLPWYDSWYGVGYYPLGNRFLNGAQATPINVETSLSYHAGFNESYEPWIFDY